MGEVSSGVLLARVLAASGIHAVYGPAPPALRPVRVDPAVAGVFASAHRAVRGSAAATWDGQGTLGVAGRSGIPLHTLTVDAPEQLPDLVAPLAAAAMGAGLTVRLEFDPKAPAPDAHPNRPPPAEYGSDVDEATARLRAVTRVDGGADVVVLAGPGVVEREAVGGLHALAAVGDLGVTNTWGAKGIFDWRSRHHWATVGLQARDFELAGLPAAGLVLASGVDPNEAGRERWAAASPLVVDPAVLGSLAERWHPPPRALRMPPLRLRLAAVTERGWSKTAAPIAPSRVTLHYGQRLGARGLVAADAGVAGYWVARTFATPRLGAALVPATVMPGWAVACVTVARLADPLIPAVAVVDELPFEMTIAMMEVAARLGVTVGVEAWGHHGDRLDARAHQARLDTLVDPGGGGLATLATDPAQLGEMVDVAGAVEAWGGLITGPR